MNYRILILSIVIFSFIICSCKKDNPTDPEPVKYESVTIGSQIWMLKNLDVDHYRNGDPIPEVKDSATWVNLSSGAWCYYNNDPAMGAIYGKLYNWFAVNDPRGLAPVGWHVPADSDWTTLTTYIGGVNIAGDKLKENGTSHWPSPNFASNETGFSALPGGQRILGYYGLGFFNIGDVASWWTTTQAGTSSAWCELLVSSASYSGKNYYSRVCGNSVRCIKD